MLDFRNWTFSSLNLRMRTIMPPNSKFRLNRSVWSRVIDKNHFQYGVRPPSWIWKFFKFSHVFVALVKICVCLPDFVKFGRFAAEIWRYNDFQNDCRPPCWIFEIGHFQHLNLRMRAIMPPNSKLRLNRTIWSRVIAKNDIQCGVRPPSWIWQFLKSSHVSVALVKICVRVPNFVIFGRFAAEL